MTIFYGDVLQKLLRSGSLSRKDRILVVCGGSLDKEQLEGLGFENVVISSLDDRSPADGFRPYEWSFQDAERLDYEDQSFDIALVHDGLHHCYSPHRALHEMYRVARKGILVMENRDSLLVRLGIAAGLVGEYEPEAVVDNDFTHGGVANGPIPNYVYRWTEREAVKTVSAINPAVRHDIRFFYGMQLPNYRLRMSKNKIRGWLLTLTTPFILLLGKIFPHQNNRFAFWVENSNAKPHPWIKAAKLGFEVDRAYLSQRYLKKSSRP